MGLIAPRMAHRRIIVVSGNSFLRSSLCRLIEDEAGFPCETIGRAPPMGDEELQAAIYDAVLLDGRNPVAALGALRAAGTDCPAVAYLDASASRDDAVDCLVAGFAAVVSQSSAPQCLLHALHTALADGIYLDRRFAEEVRPMAVARPPAPVPEDVMVLSRRERDVLELLASGCSNKEIAGELGVSEKTVETYRHRGCAKLGLSGRRAVFDYARRAGWL